MKIALFATDRLGGFEHRRRAEQPDAAALPPRAGGRIARPQRVVPHPGHRGRPHRPRPAARHAGRPLLAGKVVQTRRTPPTKAAGDGAGRGARPGAPSPVRPAPRVRTDVGPRRRHPPREHPHAHVRQVPVPRSPAARHRPRLSHRPARHEVISFPLYRSLPSSGKTVNLRRNLLFIVLPPSDKTDNYIEVAHFGNNNKLLLITNYICNV